MSRPGERDLLCRALLLSFRGRCSVADYRWAVVFVLSAFTTGFIVLNATLGWNSTWLLYPPAYWSLTALSVKRCHDLDRSGWYLLWIVVPLLGPLGLFWSLFVRHGRRATNRYGGSPEGNLDYFVVPSNPDAPTVIDDVTGMNPITVARVLRPQSIAELQDAIRHSTGTVSIGGGRFSMGGQIASANSLHVDLRGLNEVTGFSRGGRWIRVQAGARWADIQRFLDPHGLSVAIMQTYANFTVGGSLSVNAHGRYVGLGPVILSTRAITLLTADGELRTCTPERDADLFCGAIGGYGALGIIVEAELTLAENKHVESRSLVLPAERYVEHFQAQVRGDGSAIFHNADLYPPSYTTVRATTWHETEARLTQSSALMELRSSFPLERYVFWVISETPFGPWRRQHLIDPLLWRRKHVRWRNYEAGYDLAELGVVGKRGQRYILQEYFVSIDRFAEFLPLMAGILRRHRVNAINVSIRHAVPDPGSMLAWARGEVFAFVLYYKQSSADHDRAHVAVWTRELIDAVLSVGGSYYLPYQPHATEDQFHRAYPRAHELFALKRGVDPEFRFSNALWDKYYAPTLKEDTTMPAASTPLSEFRAVFSDPAWSDRFYLFLQNIYHLYPEDRFHALIKATTDREASDREIYQQVHAELPKIKPFLAPLTHALPALKKQKREMTSQTLTLLGETRACNGYVEIGSTGRYLSELKKYLNVTGPVFITNDVAPSNSLGDIMERGGFRQLGTFLPLDYGPLDGKGIAPGSIDLVTAYIGLHHAPLEKLDEFVASIHRILRPGGVFIIRDHDADSPQMDVFVSLVHTVFNLGLDVTWDENEREFKSFRSADAWSKLLVGHGFRDLGYRLLQDHDPSANTLMGFRK